MILLDRSLRISTLLLLLALGSHGAAAAAQRGRRRLVAPGQSIADAVRNAHASGEFKGQFTVQAGKAGTDETEEFEVREATAAVDGFTSLSGEGGKGQGKGKVDVKKLSTLLVGDGPGLTILAVDTAGGGTRGISVGGGASGHGTKISQAPGAEVRS